MSEMMMDAPTGANPQQTGVIGGRWLYTVVTLTGPWLSVAVLASRTGTEWLRPDQLGLVLTVALLFWCPMFFSSVPAMLMQDVRDRSLPQLTGAAGSSLRAMLLLPWLLLAKDSPVRFETTVSLIGFALGVLAALAQLN